MNAEQTFSELPKEIIFEILNKLDPIHRLIVRNVSKSLRSMIDAQKPNIFKLTFFENHGKITIYLNNSQWIDFHKVQEGSLVKYEGKRVVVPDAWHVELAMNFLKPVLANPKFQLHTFHLEQETHSKVFEHYILKIFSQFPFPVESFGVETATSICPMRLVSALKPGGFLKEIGIFSPQLTNHGIMKFIESSHFKEAETMELLRSGAALDFNMIDRFLHFRMFDIALWKISIDQIFQLREKLLKNFETFQNCQLALRTELDLDEVALAFGKQVQDDEVVHTDCICGSKFYYYFEFKKNNIEILKGTRDFELDCEFCT
ncbi:unnamed protein product [Caenorhabditis brenneri]